MNVKISLCLPEDEAYIRLVRQIGRTLLKHHDASEEDIDAVETVLGELCANVTRHARSESGSFEVALEHRGDHVTVTVADQGPGFDPALTLPAGTARPGPSGTTRHGGYGLSLVRALVDNIEFHTASSRGTIVRAKKKIRGRGAGAAGTPAHNVR